MPYIDHRTRTKVKQNPEKLDSPGELNYVISRLCTRYIDRMGDCYKTYNDVIGVLEAAKLEFYRRMVAPYEDGKLKENGEVYIRYDSQEGI